MARTIELVLLEDVLQASFNRVLDRVLIRWMAVDRMAKLKLQNLTTLADVTTSAGSRTRCQPVHSASIRAGLPR